MEGDKQNIFSVNGGSEGRNSTLTPAVISDMIKLFHVLSDLEGI